MVNGVEKRKKLRGGGGKKIKNYPEKLNRKPVVNRMT